MNFLELLLRGHQRASYRRALAHERQRRLALTPESEASVFRRVRDQLASDTGAVPFGSLPNGDVVQIDDPIALMSALVSGATGSGKTRFLLGYLFAYVDRLLSAAAPLTHNSFRFELELIDPKRETFDLFAQHLAALWLEAD